MKRKTLVGAAALVIGLSLLGTTVVAAQGISDRKGAFTLRGEGGPPFPGGPWATGMQPWWEGMKAKIADFLGITEGELDEAHDAGTRLHELVEDLGIEPADFQQAMTEFRSEAIQEALEEGRIDEEQAEWLLEHPGPRRPGQGVHGHFGPIGDARWDEVIADVLGISVEDFQAAREEGITLVELAAELELDKTDLQDALAEAHAQMLAEAVEEGRITEEQAQRMLDHGPMSPGAGLRFGGGRFGGDCRSNR